MAAGGEVNQVVGEAQPTAALLAIGWKTGQMLVEKEYADAVEVEEEAGPPAAQKLRDGSVSRNQGTPWIP